MKRRRITVAELRTRIDAIDPRDAINPIPLDPVESRARAAFERDAGAPMTEGEWREAKQNLLSFFAILAEWRRDDRDESRSVHARL
jgi:hypothetical protein